MEIEELRAKVDELEKRVKLLEQLQELDEAEVIISGLLSRKHDELLARVARLEQAKKGGE